MLCTVRIGGGCIPSSGVEWSGGNIHGLFKNRLAGNDWRLSCCISAVKYNTFAASFLLLCFIFLIVVALV